MAIPNWKRIQNEENHIIYENTNSGIEIWVISPEKSGKGKGWEVYKNSITNSGSKGFFKSRAEAVNFLIKYMRENKSG